jgi:hypothetical protein
MTQDLTQITTPFGLLDVETQNALKAAFLDGKEIQFYTYEGFWKTMGRNPIWSKIATYRVKPAPVTVSTWCNVYPWGVACSCATREDADEFRGADRIAVLRIDNTDGELTFHKEDV